MSRPKPQSRRSLPPPPPRDVDADDVVTAPIPRVRPKSAPSSSAPLPPPPHDATRHMPVLTREALRAATAPAATATQHMPTTARDALRAASRPAPVDPPRRVDSSRAATIHLPTLLLPHAEEPLVIDNLIIDVTVDVPVSTSQAPAIESLPTVAPPVAPLVPHLARQRVVVLPHHHASLRQWASIARQHLANRSPGPATRALAIILVDVRAPADTPWDVVLERLEIWEAIHAAAPMPAPRLSVRLLRVLKQHGALP